MNKLVKSLCCCALLLLLSSVLGAEQTGEIRGKITDDKGEILPGVSITATSPSLQGMRTALSDRNGNFRLPLLPVGTYSLTFELGGFEKLSISAQDVRLGFAVDISIKLKPAAVKEEVTVTAAAPLIDKTKTDTSYRLNSDELTRVPIQSRTISEVVGLTPGVTGVRSNTISGASETGLPSFRGEGDAGNNWLVDGLSGRGGIFDPGVQVNYDAWEEVQIISDGFTPEMGQALGGFINIVTKSGGNDFHGELGGLIRSQHLRAERQEQLSLGTMPDTSLSQYFGNLGGPIVRDKLWFFLSGNYFGTLDQSTEQTVGWLTIPSGERRVRTNNVFGKVTFTPWKSHTISLGGTLDKSLSQSGGIGVPETYQVSSYTNSFYRLNYQGILSQNTLLTAAWGQNRRKNDIRPLSGDYGTPSYYWLDIAQTTNNSLGGSAASEWKSELTVNLTQYFDLKKWGSHELKAGFSYSKNGTNGIGRGSGSDSDPWPGDGFDDGVSITWAAPGIPIQLNEWADIPYRDSTQGIGLYVQDSVSVGRFSFMLGLRSDTQRIFNNVGEVAWSWDLGDFIQPRASATLDLTGDGRNVLKFGYGRFAIPISMGALAGLINTTSVMGFRLYEWLGPQDPTDSQLINPANWGFIFEWSSVAAPEQVDPGLRPNKADKYLLEFDRQLGQNWALKIRGVYSRSNNLLDDIGVYDPEISGSVRYVFTNVAIKRRDYKALEFELNGRIAGRFMLNASYTWSQAKGTNTGNSLESYGWGGGYVDPYDWSFFGNRPVVPDGAPDKDILDSLYFGLGGAGFGDDGWYGFLPYSVDYIVKVLGTYLAPYGVTISSNIEFLSGYHWEKKGWSEMGFFCLFPEGRGARTTPAHMYVDLAVEKDFRLKRGMTLILGINAYNLLNSQQPVAFAKEDNE
ncbi:MAG: TonB-dependent receptor, partial [Candidatus Aminicenantales bacterium]